MYAYTELNPKIITKNKTISETKVTDEAMEDAIQKVYDSVLCIEVMNSDGSVLSTGTGFVYSKDSKYGYVLTNAHVVSSGNNIVGVLSNNNTTSLTVLGSDTYTDLAVLRMDVKDVLGVASIGNSKNTPVGNTVFTVGSPMGSTYAGTVTKGILSGKDRLIETSASNSNSHASESYIVNVLQTDAAISPGNSGGPLVNLAGDVIGITSLKLVDEQVEGMGFAIPIDSAKPIIEQLIQYNKVKRPYIGISGRDLDETTAKRNNLVVGVYVASVDEYSAAEKAGIKAGDVIVKADGQEIKTMTELNNIKNTHNIGDTMTVTVNRNGQEKEITLTLQEQ